MERALEAAELKREVAELKLRAGEAKELIGASSAIKQIRVVVERAAPTDRRVFITGPAGAGKEVIARLIHSQSRRSSGPFIVANAAMMRPDHVELELFGSEGDGPGGTRARKIGTFERAHRGTLFFDEIADMPFETQGKIARALQANTFEREGGTQQIEVDIRVMAATTRDMETEIEEGRFREDLYYRLQVTPIEGCQRSANDGKISQSWRVSSFSRRLKAPAFPRARLRPMRWRCCSPSTGPATCASSAISWNG